MKKLFLSLLMLTAVISAAALADKADYRVVPLPDRIDGIKDTDFRLKSTCLVDYPTGNRDMERNAAVC